MPPAIVLVIATNARLPARAIGKPGQQRSDIVPAIGSDLKAPGRLLSNHPLTHLSCGSGSSPEGKRLSFDIKVHDVEEAGALARPGDGEA